MNENTGIRPKGRRARRRTQTLSFTTKLLVVFFATLVGLIGSNTGGPLPVAEAAFSNKCDGTAANDQNNLRVTPNHGQVLYIDSGQGQQIDAAYAAYSVQNLAATSRSNLWVKLDTFTGGKVQLANNNDASFAVGDLSASASGTSFFLLKALGTATTSQSHVVRVFQGKPGVVGSTELYSCTYNFTKVAETIKAAANKVTDISATSVTSVGSTMKVTVLGATGTVGSGNATDGAVMWFSPSGRSSWPTQSLRLENTSIQFFSNASRGSNQRVGSAYLNKLRVSLSELQTAGSTTDKSFYYTAEYTYRILGASATAASLVPVAQIASGTQMKHTDVGSIATAGTTSIAVTAPTVSLAVNKSVSPTAVVSGGTTSLSYTISLVNSGSSPLTVDQVTDKPDSSLSYKAASAKFNGSTILDPGYNTSSGELIFSGPFSVTANSTRTITYELTTSTCLSGTFSYSNSATATVGSTVIGSGATTMSITSASGTCGSTSVTAQSTTVALPIEVDTDIASVTGNSTATIYGLIDPNGDTGSAVYFDYGTSPSLAGATRVNVGSTAGQTAPYSVNKALTGLSSGTVYYYRVGAGSTLGTILSFVTTEPVANPTATTGAISNLALVSSKINVTLNGTIDPNQVVNGAKITFQYAVDNSSGACTSLGTSVNVPSSGFLQDDVAADVVLSGAFPTEVNTGSLVTGLTNGTRYCFKVRGWYNASSASWSTAVDGSWVPFLAKVRLTQSISYATPNDMTTGGTQNTTASATSGLVVTYISNSPDICSVTSSGQVTALSAGSCSISVSQSGNNDYDPAETVTVLFTVSPGPPVISTSSLADGVIDSSYSQTLDAIEGNGSYTNWRISSGALPAGVVLDSTTGTLSGTPSVAGSYTVAFLVDSGAQSSVAKTLTLVVSKKSQTISVENILKTYGDSSFSPGGTASSGLEPTYSVPANSVVTLSGGSFAISGAGSVTITVSQAGNDTYAAAANMQFTITVSKAPLAVAAPSISLTYGDAVPSLSPGISGWVLGESESDLSTVPSCSTGYSSSTSVSASPVAVTCSGGVSANYSFSYTAGSITIGKAALVVSAPSASLTYGDAKPSLAPSYSGFVNGQSASVLSTVPSCSTGYSSSTSVSASPVAVTCSGGVSANYSFSYTAGSITIGKAALVVSAPSASLTYGDAKPSLAPSYSGFVNGQSASVLSTVPSCSTGYSSSTSVSASPVAVTCSGGVSANYSFSYTAGSITIGKAALTIQAPSLDLVYGDAAPSAGEMAPQITGFVNSENSSVLVSAASCATNYASGKAAGSTNYVRCSGASAENYSIDFRDGVLTVAKTPLRVTAPSHLVTYGDSKPSLASDISGWVLGESESDLSTVPSCSTGYSSSTSVSASPVAVTCSGGVSANYSFSYTAGSITIGKAALVVSAPSASLTYGDAKPSLAPSYSGFVNGQSASVLSTVPSCSTGYSSSTSVSASPVAVTCSGGVSANYSFSYTAGSITIGKAALVVSAPSASLTYGDAKPSLAPSYSGFVNGQSASVLSTVPSCSTGYSSSTSVSASPVAVTCSGGVSANYSFSYTAGSITIGKAALTIQAPSLDLVYGDAAPSAGEMAPQITGFVNSENAQTANVLVDCVTDYVAGMTVADSPREVTCLADEHSNYRFDYLDADLTINRAALTIRSLPVTVQYGDEASTYSFETLGWVLGESEAEFQTVGVCFSGYQVGTQVGEDPVIECASFEAANYYMVYQDSKVTVERAVDQIQSTPASLINMRPASTQEIKFTTRSGLPVSVEVRGGCTYDEENQVLTAPVTIELPVLLCEIEVSRGESRNFTGAQPISLSVQVAGAPKVTRTIESALNKPIQVFELDESLSLSATVKPNVGNIQYKSQHPQVCTIDAAGIVTLKIIGTCQLIAFVDETDDYAAAFASPIEFEVAKITRVIKMSASPTTVFLPQGSNLSASLTPNEGSIEFRVAGGASSCWIVDNQALASLQGQCKIFAVAPETDRYSRVVSSLVTVTFIESKVSEPTAVPTPTITAPPVQPQPSPEPTTPQETEPPVIWKANAKLPRWILSIPSPGDRVAPGVPPRSVDSIDKVDAGSGPVEVDVKTAVTPANFATSKTLTLEGLRSEKFEGYAARSGVRIDVAGVRTAGQFVYSGLGADEVLGMKLALEESTSRLGVNFAQISSVKVIAKPGPEKVISGPITDEISNLFSASGLSSPRVVGQMLTGDEKSWLSLKMKASTYLPGTVAYLVVQSSPIILGAAVVDKEGNATLDGYLPLEVLDLGPHKLSIVGYRSLTGVSVDANGEVILASATVEEIDRFDDGSTATVSVFGGNASGGVQNAIREILLAKQEPWVWLLLPFVGVLLGAIWAASRRYFSRTNVLLSSFSATLLSVVPAWLAWTSSSWLVLGLAAIEFLAFITVFFIFMRRRTT